MALQDRIIRSRLLHGQLATISSIVCLKSRRQHISSPCCPASAHVGVRRRISSGNTQSIYQTTTTDIDPRRRYESGTRKVPCISTNNVLRLSVKELEREIVYSKEYVPYEYWKNKQDQPLECPGRRSKHSVYIIQDCPFQTILNLNAFLNHIRKTKTLQRKGQRY